MLDQGRHSPFFGKEIGWESRPPDYFHEVLESLASPPYPDRTREIGRILLSAISYGALLNRAAWDQFVFALPKCRLLGDLPSVEMMIVSPKSPTGLKPWRWYADPVTRALIERWHRITPLNRRSVKATADECLTAFLRGLNSAPKDARVAIDKLLSWATHEARLRMPALLVDQAIGTLPTVELSTYNYGRLCGEKKTNARARANEVLWPKAKRRSAHLNAYEATREWVRDFAKSHTQLCSAFNQAIEDMRTGRLGHGQVKVQCIANLEVAAATASSAEKRAIAWCQALLETDRSPYRRGFSPYTVRLRLLALLMGVFQGNLPSSLEDLDRKNILIQCRNAMRQETCPTRTALIRRAALDFVHFEEDRAPISLEPEDEERLEESSEDFLEVDHLAQEVGNITDGERQTLVSANLVSGLEYLRIIGLAYERQNGDELALIIMLGFRTGMRLREILGLETCDILHRGNFLELHLQENRRRQLKTFQSRRIFPLNLLLTRNERNALLKWLRPRKELANAQGRPVLVFGALHGIAMPDEWAYRTEIATLFRRVRGEWTLRFSHLRHSFGSYLLLNLLIPSAESEKLVPESFRGQVTWDRKWQLLPALIGKGRLGHSSLHAVSQMMGHTGILRTLESYQHLLSLAVGLYVNRQISLPHLPVKTIEALGLKELPCADDRTQLVHSPYWAKLSAQLVQLPPYSDHLRPFKEAKSVSAKPGNWYSSRIRGRKTGAVSDNSFKMSWRFFLDLVSNDEASSKEQASNYGIDPPKVAKWRARYKQILASAFAPGALPDGLTQPRGTNAQTVTDRIWSKLPDSPTDRQKFLLKRFLDAFRSKRYHTVFTTVEDAVEFADFLRSVGFSGDHLFIGSGPSSLIDSYKNEPEAHLFPQRDEEGITRYRSPEDLLCRAAEGREDGSPAPVVFWFRYMKFEPDELGLHYDSRYRLDSYNERKDELIIASGAALSEPRKRAAEKRQARADLFSKRTKSTVFASGNKAYRFSLLLAAVYYDIELAVEFPQPPHRENLRKRDRRIAAEGAD